MATRTWKGVVSPVAQVTDYVFGGTWETSDIVIVTIGSKSVSITAGSVTTNTVVDNVVTAWNALSSTYWPEFAEITASRSSSSLRLTGDVPGVPFACTVSTTETGGGAADSQTIDGGSTSTGTDATACSGPNFWSVAGNWAENSVPVNSDDVVIDGVVDILYGVAQSGVTLTSLTVNGGYQGKIGLPVNNSRGYVEYRATELAIGATTQTIGQGFGLYSGRIRINNGTIQTALTVYNLTRPTNTGYPSMSWRGTHASNVVRVIGTGSTGNIGIATEAGQSATIASLYIASGTVYSGTGVTLTTIENVGGTLETSSAATTISSLGGTTTLLSGAHTTINVQDSTVNYNSSGTITNLNVYVDGTATFNGANVARTVSNATLYSGGEILDSAKTVTWTNGVDLIQCGLPDVTLDLGQHITVTPSVV